MVDTKKLRCILGWLGIILPIIVAILSLAFGYSFPESISATYYRDPCITPFMIILGAAGLFLVCYDGYDKQDEIICTLAGIFGLGICLFPCADSILEKVGTFQIPLEVSGWIHNICAISFFVLLAYNSIFLFTKGSDNPTENKCKRNIIFRICGVGMIASFILLIPFNIFNVQCGVWIVEALALSFFGISWLTKAQRYSWLFKDK